MLMTSAFGFSNKSNTIRGFSNMVPVWKVRKLVEVYGFTLERVLLSK
jgi:hypothetical protein